MQRQDAPRLGEPGVEVLLADLVGVEPREVEQRDAERTGRKHRELLCRQPLAGQDLLDERNAGGLGLRLERLGLGFGHDAVLGERAG